MKDLLRARVVVFKYEFSRRLEEYAQKDAPKSVQHDFYPHSPNQIFDLWR